MERISLTPENHAEAAQRAATVLSKGGIVIYPTETMYGVGVDGLNADAVTRVLSFKNRPAGKAVSVMVADMTAAERYVELTDSARQVYASFLPGPVTVVSKDRGVVDPRLPSELGALGIRISSHPFVDLLARVYGRPITSTSANPSGGARPYSIEGLFEQLSDRQLKMVDLVVDAGQLPRNEPSTVIDTTGPVQEVLRAGAGVEDLAPAFHSTSEEKTMEFAAGLLRQFSHVLAEKPLVFALEGDMGMGKTQFAKGVGKALGIAKPITSPTYSLVKEYEGNGTRFVHMDLWRAEGADPEEIGLDEYVTPGNVIVIEWAAPVLDYLRGLAEEIVLHRLVIEADGEGRSIRMVKP